MMLMPTSIYYRRRIADEAAWGQHELYLLGEVVSPGGTAIDVCANQGFFAYAFSKIIDEVEAFEPNPDCAAFARRMLGARANLDVEAPARRMVSARFLQVATQVKHDLLLRNGDDEARPSRLHSRARSRCTRARLTAMHSSRSAP